LRNFSQTLNINIEYYYLAFVFGLYTNLCTEDATSEIQDPAATAHLRAPKRQREKSTQNNQEEMISLENKKLEWFIKHEENDEDLNFFRFQVTYMKQMPPTTKKKLFLRSQFQNMVADEVSALQNNLLHLQFQV
jgi:hypothetical protein